LTQLRKESMNLNIGQERLSKLKLDRKKSGRKSTQTEQEGTVSNSFYEASITLKTKSDKGITRKKLLWIITLHRCKNPQ